MTIATASVQRRTCVGRRATFGHVASPLVVVIGAVFAAPGVFVVWRALRLGASFGDTARQLAGPAWRSAVLTITVSATCAVIGTALAWLVTSTDLPGRSWWRVVLIAPIVLPSFVGATAVLSGLTPGGALRSVFEFVGLSAPQRVRGLFPAWLMLSAFSYPFVMLPVMARLGSLRPSLGESARLLGCSARQVWWRVTLPHIRSAIVGGALIVALYMMSEFGAVQLFGYDTLTRVIYATRQTDRPTSFMAAAMLFVVSVALVAAVRRTDNSSPVDDRTSLSVAEPVALGAATFPALIGCATVALVGLGAPVVSLAGWAVRGITEDRIRWSGLVRPTANSAVSAVLAAALAVAVVWPVANAVVRRRSVGAKAAGVAVVSGFALPSLVVALALAALALNTPVVDALYQTFPLLIVAHVIHFGSQALASVEGGVRAVAPSIRESARLLETSWWRRVLHVDVPLMRPSFVAGGGLVMLAVMKELPATLLLSPLGFRTLSTEIWASFEEGFLADAAVASLVMIAVSASLTWILVVRVALKDGHESARPDTIA